MRASRRWPASATTVASPWRKTSTPPIASASADDRRPRLELALEQGPGQRVLHEALDRPLQRPGPVRRVRSLAHDQRLRRRRQLQGDLLAGQPALQIRDQQVHDGRQVRVVEGVEDDDLVDRG